MEQEGSYFLVEEVRHAAMAKLPGRCPALTCSQFLGSMGSTYQAYLWPALHSCIWRKLTKDSLHWHTLRPPATHGPRGQSAPPSRYVLLLGLLRGQVPKISLKQPTNLHYWRISNFEWTWELPKASTIPVLKAVFQQVEDPCQCFSRVVTTKVT